MTISEAYTTIDNCNHFLACAKKFFMLRLKRFIGADKEAELKTPVSVEIPEKGFVDVCKVSYSSEYCLWLYWKDPNVIPSGYNVAQSWKAERVEGNRWVEKLKEIVDQFEEKID
jgi:hypothetical protein